MSAIKAAKLALISKLVFGLAKLGYSNIVKVGISRGEFRIERDAIKLEFRFDKND